MKKNPELVFNLSFSDQTFFDKQARGHLFNWVAPEDFKEPIWFKGGFGIVVSQINQLKMQNQSIVFRWNVRTRTYLYPILFSLLITFGCSQTKAPDENVDEQTVLTEDVANEVAGVGGQKDEHGCLIAAGYTWSQVKKECVRIFESGIRLNPQDTSLDQTTSAFIIFNEEQTVAELFLPFEKGSLLLERTGAEGNYQWKYGDYALSVWKGYVLTVGNKTLYHGE